MVDHYEPGHIAALMQSVLGAGESIDVMADLDPRTSMSSPLADALGSVTALADQRLRLRCIIHWPEDTIKRKQVRADAFGDEISMHGWEVRTLITPSIADLMIVDGQIVHFLPVAPSSFGPYLLFKEQQMAEHFRRHFEEIWETSTGAMGEPERQIIYEDLIPSSLPEYHSEVIRVSQETWGRLISELAQNPSRLFQLGPRQFEEVVAELLIHEGMEVQLTKPTRDGGRDILALHRGSAGRHLYLIECKRYAPERPISVDMVRALYGVVEQERATAGVLITTSRFTTDALAFVRPIQYRITLKEYSDLVAWIRRCVGLHRS